MSFFSDIKQNYEMLWKAIIRPPRAQYEEADLGTVSLTQAPENSKLGTLKSKELTLSL